MVLGISTVLPVIMEGNSSINWSACFKVINWGVFVANTGKTRVDRLKEDILSGPIIKTILVLGWPVMISNGLQMLYNLVDTYWLGKLGKVAVAAPTVGFPVVFLLISLGSGFSIAGVSLVSQHTGAGSEKNANEAAGQVMSFMFISALVMSVGGYFLAPFLLKTLMGVPEDVYPKALSYIRIIFWGMPTMFIFFAFRALIRGIGDMVTPMLITGGSMVANVILDPILIFGLAGLPEMGVAGAAMATILSRAVASVVAIYLLFSDRIELRITLKSLRLRFHWVSQIIKIGLPSAIGQMGTAIGFVLLMGLVSRIGVVAVSAYGIGQRIISLLNISIWGLASPLTTMIGQNIGAENKERAIRAAHRSFALAFGTLFALAVTVYFFRRPLFRVFIDDPAVIDVGARFLTVFIWSIPFFGIFSLVSSVFRGSGHTRPPMVLSLIRLLVLRVGISYLLAFSLVGINMGADGLWLGLFISNTLSGIMAFAWFLRGTWLEKTIDQAEPEPEPLNKAKESADLSGAAVD